MSKAASPKSSGVNAAALLTLLELENNALDAPDLIALRYLAVNRPRNLIQAGHIFWITRRGNKVKIEAMSSQSKVDETTPFIQWMTQRLGKQARQGKLSRLAQWTLENSSEDTPFTYPFTHALYAPFAPEPENGGLLFAREYPFEEIDHRLAGRLAKIFGLTAASARIRKRRKPKRRKPFALWTGAALMALALIVPVPMTTLAPAEIVTSKPYILTAPFNGIVEDILVPPNMPVEKNTPILRFVDTSYQNEFILAGKEEAIAEAKLRQAAVGSFVSDGVKSQVAIAKAEKALAAARQDYARERLAKTVLTAPKEGLAIYSDPADWRGRHVTTGEAIIQIADPAKLRLRIEAPLSMGESLNGGARVKLFLDNAPLNTLDASLTSASYYAKSMPGGHMAYEAYADLEHKEGQPLPRIGARGVAKIHGNKVPLGYWLLRRPITILRQSLGA